MKRLYFLLLCLLLLFAFPPSSVSSAEGTFAFENPVSVKIGIYENEPKIFTDNEGNATGFWAEITEYIAQEEGWDIEWVHGSWDECLNMLANGEINIMVDVAHTEARSLLYEFSEVSVLTSWSCVYAGNGIDIGSILDLEGKSIAVLKGSINYEGPEGIKALVDAFHINCTFVELNSYIEVFETVSGGEVDAGVVSKDFGNTHEEQYNLQRTPIIFQPSQIYYAFNPDNPLNDYFIETIDNNIRQLKNDKESFYYDKLDTWFGGTVGNNVIPVWIWWTAGGLMLAVILLVGGSFVLRSQVSARTSELTAEITRRQQAEEELKESYGKLEELVKERTSELKEKTDALEEANVHLQEVNRHKSVFLANMSHELRTPLNSIIGYTKLMYDGLEGDINDEQKQDLLAVYNNGKNLLELINGLLDLSKIEAGKIIMAYEVFPVSGLVNEIVTTIEPLTRAKGLTLTYNIDPVINKIYADRAKIRQVLLNILGNSVKFTSKGGIELDITADEDNYIFTVTDTGIGIVEENLEVIFDSFVQVGPAQIAGYAGTGLGLAVCRQFIEMQGGRIWAESERGKGSRFIFTLPKDKKLILNH